MRKILFVLCVIAIAPKGYSQCTYNGSSYNKGAVVCMNGSQYQCDGNSWSPIGGTCTAEAPKTRGAKNSIKIKLTSKAYEKTKGSDPNIKSDIPSKDKKLPRSRGANSCQIYFDNYSGLYVNVYVDGDFMGTLSPYGNLTVNAEGGYATIYCVSSGGTRYWSDHGSCDGYYKFTLD